MIRLGLCCKFLKESIRFRTTTITYLKKLKTRNEDPYLYLNNIILSNIASLKNAITYCSNHKIGCFRISSDFFPGATHPDFLYTIDDLPSQAIMKEELSICKDLAQQSNIRLTFHPNQFVVINSPKTEVVEKAILDLEHHNRLAELVSADVINIHLGGAYNDKTAAIKRFESNFKKLSVGVQEKLTIENDDKTYTPKEILPVCNKLGIPLVYDVHHHRCLPDALSIEEATTEAIKTWNREPLFHISSPIHGWNTSPFYPHHDFININDFPAHWKSLSNITIEVEAKAKELAIQQLIKDLGLYT